MLEKTWDLVTDLKYLCWYFMWLYLSCLLFHLTYHVSQASLEYLLICSPHNCTLCSMVDSNLTYFIFFTFFFPFSFYYLPRSARGVILYCLLPLWSVNTLSKIFLFVSDLFLLPLSIFSSLFSSLMCLMKSSQAEINTTMLITGFVCLCFIF